MVKLNTLKKGAISTDTLIWALIAVFVLFIVIMFITGGFTQIKDGIIKVWDWLFGWFKPTSPSFPGS